MLIDIIIYIMVAILLTVLIARLREPLNLIVTGLVALTILIMAIKLFGLGWFSLLLLLWMAAITAGLFILRNSLRQKHHHARIK